MSLLNHKPLKGRLSELFIFIFPKYNVVSGTEQITHTHTPFSKCNYFSFLGQKVPLKLSHGLTTAEHTRSILLYPIACLNPVGQWMDFSTFKNTCA